MACWKAGYLAGRRHKPDMNENEAKYIQNIYKIYPKYTQNCGQKGYRIQPIRHSFRQTDNSWSVLNPIQKQQKSEKKS